MEITVSPKHAGKLDRVKEGKCLHCDEKPTRRGLCERHYQLFRRNKLAKPNTRERAEFEKQAIEQAKILPIQQMRELQRDSSNDPFADM